METTVRSNIRPTAAFVRQILQLQSPHRKLGTEMEEPKHSECELYLEYFPLQDRGLSHLRNKKLERDLGWIWVLKMRKCLLQNPELVPRERNVHEA